MAFLCAMAAAASADDLRIPILVYHRFAERVTDSMTIRTDTLEWQLRFIDEAGYTVIPLRRLVDCRRGLVPCPTEKSVVLTADDGHRSVYSDMRPAVLRHRVPVTLFIYPSAISRADYALRWEQLRDLAATGWFDVQSHTFWHPNFKTERKRLGAAEYERFVRWQLTQSRAALEKEIGKPIEFLAWPFGIFDDQLIGLARETGYVAALTLERRHSTARDPLMALPRYLVTDRDRGPAFARLLAGGAQ